MTHAKQIVASFRDLDGERAMKARVLALIETHDDDEIAEDTGLPISFVRLVTRDFREASGVWVRCNRTNRIFRARNFRGAYRQVCLRGLTDWDFGKGAVQ